MKNLRTIILVIATAIVFWLIKFQLGFPAAGMEMVSLILTITSILFGLLVGFFISELWSRYTEIRELQSTRSSEGINMIEFAEEFFKNKRFKSSFTSMVEKAAIADEVVEWNEGELELPYYRAIEKSFSGLKVSTKKDEGYFDKLMASYQGFVEATVRLDALGKERLFISEWVILTILSLIIMFSVLFLDTSHIFFKAVIIIFPAIIVLAISTVYDLDTLTWSKNTVSLEPNERIFDALGKQRFYLKKKKNFLNKAIKSKGYRTEDDLKGDLKKVYLEILKKRNP